MSYTIHVSNLAPATTQAKLEDFFTFCGKIKEVDFKETEKSATVHFEKASAAKTALMLNGGTLDGSHLTVTSEYEHQDDDDASPTAEGVPYHQSDKPRAGIAAEYLAKGYTLSDQILQRAIDMDNQRGISKRFLAYIQSLDTQVGSKALGPDQTISGTVSEKLLAAHGRAKSIDEQKGVSKTLGDYYSWATGTPVGQKVLQFYSTTSKQVLDIHEEARRISTQQKEGAGATTGDVPLSAVAGQENYGTVEGTTTEKAPTVV